jgi:hypothetical protein
MDSFAILIVESRCTCQGLIAVLDSAALRKMSCPCVEILAPCMDLREIVKKFWNFATAYQQSRHDNIHAVSLRPMAFGTLRIHHRSS